MTVPGDPLARLEEHGGWRAVLASLVAGQDLSAETAEVALDVILAGESTPAQIAAFVIGLAAKGESPTEITGMVRAMQRAAEPLALPPDAVDIVGMGGGPTRRAHAVNVSTMACFVAAGAGATVCKHGNRKASSTSGSFDLLEALGVPVDLTPVEVAACVAEIGVGFAFARTFHPAMRHAGPVRAELGVPTVFNILGPLSHPGRLTRQVVGVSNGALLDVVASVLAANKARHALVVHGHGDLDELATTGPSTIVEVRDGRIEQRTFDPTSLGLPLAAAADLRGGDAAVNAAIAARVLDAGGGPLADLVALNAAAGLVVAGRAEGLAEGLAQARAAISSGAAKERLDALRRWAR